MATILLSVDKSQPWSPGHSLEPALGRTGHPVHVFDYGSSEDPNDELLAAVDAIAPDLHVIYEGERYEPDAIEAVRSKGVPTALWFTEVTPKVRPDTVALAGPCDAFFTMAEGLVKPFRDAGVADPRWLPEGMEPSIFGYEGISERDREVYGCDVTLVGKLESDNPAYMERWKLVKRIVDEGIDFKWWGPRIHRKIGTFVLGLLLSKVSRAYGGRFVWDDTYAKAVHLSKIFLAREAYPNIRLSLSARAFTAMGLGAFYLCYHTKGIETMFEPDKELVLFEDADEMIDKIRHYLDHEEERLSISSAACERVLAEHTYQHRFERMFELLAEQGIDV
ncbi:MAG: glycosyltransferase [Planctomycetota bacterium]